MYLKCILEKFIENLYIIIIHNTKRNHHGDATFSMDDLSGLAFLDLTGDLAVDLTGLLALVGERALEGERLGDNAREDDIFCKMSTSPFQ